MPVNSKTGQSYTIQKAPGGVYHVYKDGRKVFVKSAAPAAAPGAPAATADPTAPDNSAAQLYYDAQAQAEAARREHNKQTSLQNIGLARSQDTSNTAEAIRRLQLQRPEEEQSAKVGANKAGLFYSGHLGKQLGDIATSYVRRQGDMETEQGQREAQRALQEQQINAGAEIDTMDSQASALGRQIQGLGSAAEGGYLVPQQSYGQAPVNPVTKLPSFKTVKKNGKIYRYYDDGRKVYKRKAI